MGRFLRWLAGGGWYVVAIGVLLAMFAFLMLGCGVGRTASGTHVFGLALPGEPSDLSEAAHQGATLAKGLLPAPFGEIIGWGLGAIGAAFAIKKGSDAARANVEVAALSGANEGWEAREKAAAVQAPLVQPINPVVAPA